VPPDALVFGLGNPGPGYAGTRHNVGFDVLDRLAGRANVAFRPWTGFVADAAEAPLAGRAVLLVKPTSYMNAAGPVLREFRDGYGLEDEALLVVVDDLALPVGRLRLRARGSDGGHNGLRSVAAALGTEEYARLRVGVGGAGARADPDYVLAPFPEEEGPLVEAALERAAGGVEAWLERGVTAAMGTVNAPSDLDRPPDGA